MRTPFGEWGLKLLIGAGLAVSAPSQAVLAQDASGAAASVGADLSQGVTQLPFVTIDEAQLFSGSLYGQRLISELEERQTALAAENRALEAKLSQREQELTEQRAKLPPEEFRRLADSFNAEVESYRAGQAQKERELYQRHERDRALFRDLSNQSLVEILRERGALAIITQDAIVLGFRDIDVTDAAIAKLDALVGDGSSLPQPNDPTPTAPADEDE